MGRGGEHGFHVSQLDTGRSAQGGGEVRLQCSYCHASVQAGVQAVTGVATPDSRAGLGQPPAARQAQVVRSTGQSHFKKHAARMGLAGTRVRRQPQHGGLQHRFARHQRAAHVGVQGGR